MRPALAFAAGVILFVLALLMTAPAALLDRRVDALSAGRVRLANATGTLWQGSGEIVLLPSGTRLPLFWRAELWPLVRGEVRATFGFDADAPRSTALVFGSDRLEVRDLELSLPVESIVRAAGPALSLAARGNLALRVERFVHRPDELDAQLSLQWNNATVPAFPPDERIALGDVRVDVAGRGAVVTGPVRNTGGEVEITGQAGVAAAGTLQLTATLRPRVSDRERAERIATALAAIGAPDGQGGYTLNLKGYWR
jgi:general secretion pathway protein N